MELQHHLPEFEAANIALFAVSYDSVDVLKGFTEDHGISYQLLSDLGSEVIRRYGILNTLVKPEEEEYYGIPFPGSYLVSEDGKIFDKLFHREYQKRETGATVLWKGFGLPVDPASTIHAEAEGQAVRVSAALMATELHPRQHADLHVTLDLDEGLHVYGPDVPDDYVATQIKVSGPEGISAGEPAFPATKPLRIEGINEEFQVMDGKVDIVLPVASAIREPGEATLNVEVTYQACTDAMCYIPRTETLHLTVNVAPNVPGRPQ